MGDNKELSWGRSGAGELLAAWPRDSVGQPEEPVFLCSCTCADMSDRLLVNMLSAYGIPCLCTDRGDGNFGRVMLGMSGEGVDIYVPKSKYTDAKTLIEEEEHEEL